MVITQAQFNKAMEEINKSFAKLAERVKELEGMVNAKEEGLKTGTGGSKRVQQAKANA